MYQFCFYVPETHLELVKAAIFKTGVIRLGHYKDGAWQVRGEGQFNPDSNSKPFVGKENHLEKVTEYKIEIVCPTKRIIRKVIKALEEVHPYEEPAYQIIKLEEL